MDVSNSFPNIGNNLTPQKAPAKKCKTEVKHNKIQQKIDEVKPSRIVTRKPDLPSSKSVKEKKSQFLKFQSEKEPVLEKKVKHQFRSRLLEKEPDYSKYAAPIRKVESEEKSVGRLEKIAAGNQQKLPRLKDIPKIVNKRFVQKYYAKDLPNEAEVTVPYIDPKSGKKEWRLWRELTREEKIIINNTGTREHNKLRDDTEELVVDKWFFVHGQEPYMEGDARSEHGNDHCVRASINASLFCHLYDKYHPKYSVTEEDIKLSMIIAAGHDSARQTEGPDVYDERSAEYTKNELIELGYKDEIILENCEEAIADKDSPPNAKKSLIAKCVQNADCAEFARLLLRSHNQDEGGFESSRNYLDIYQELKRMAEEISPDDPNSAILKDGRTFGEFRTELDILRKEINHFIYETHNREFRTKALSADDYFSAYMQAINPTEHPAMSTILTNRGIKPLPLTPEELRKERIISQAKTWEAYGFEKISKKSLKNIAKCLKEIDSEKSRPILLNIKKEQELRKLAEQEFLGVLNKEPIELDRFIVSYGKLPGILKAEYRTKFLQLLNDVPVDVIKKIVNSLQDKNEKKIASISLLDIQHTLFKRSFEAGRRKRNESAEYAIMLKEGAEDLLLLYQNSDKKMRDQGVQTTAALALTEAARICFKQGLRAEAKEMLEIAGKGIVIDPSNRFYDLDGLFKDKPPDSFMYLPADSNFLDKRKVRVCERVIDNKKFHEISFELNPVQRKQMEEFIKYSSWRGKKVFESKYLRKDQTGYHDDKFGVKVGLDYKFESAHISTFEPGVEISIGKDSTYWNQYHLVRIKVAEGVAIQEVHEALSNLGLPMALMPSREEDVREETLSRCIEFRYPQLVVDNISGDKTSLELYELLTSEQQRVIDNDIQNTKLTQVRDDHFEIVQPEVGEEAWERGVRAVGNFIYAGNNFSQTAEVLKKIVKGGLMSSEERFQNGILGLGCVPLYNYQGGSGNQVFTRILTKNLFEEKVPFNNFPVNGQILILMDPQCLERLPYFYLKDRGGVRNPDFYTKEFRVWFQEMEPEFKGAEKMKERTGFGEHIETLNQKQFPINECMFHLNMGPKYIQRLVVWNEKDRKALIASLQKEGIYHISSVPVEEVVVAADHLNPDLIKNYHEKNPYEKESKNEIEYV